MPNDARGGDVARHADEVRADGGTGRQRRGEPVARRRGVGERLLRREGLGHDDEQRGLRVESVQRPGRGAPGRRWRRSARPEDCRRRPAARPARRRPGAARGRSRRCRCARRRGSARPVAPRRRPSRSVVASAAMRACAARTAGITSLPVDLDRRVVLLAQRHVQRRPALALVDLLAGEQRRDPRRQPGGVGLAQQRGDDLFRQPLLRQVDEPAVPATTRRCRTAPDRRRRDRRAWLRARRRAGIRGVGRAFWAWVMALGAPERGVPPAGVCAAA